MKTEETQSEFFDQFSPDPKRPERFPALQKGQKPILLSTSLEQIIFASILLILVLCLIFFLGILRGRFLSNRVRTAPIPITLTSNKPVSNLIQAPTPRLLVGAAPAPVLPGIKNVEIKENIRRPLPASVNANLDKPYTIQLITYKKKDLAEKEVFGLRQNGFYSFIIPSGDYFQVCAGQYATKDQAKKDLKTFGGKYKDCYLRRR